MQQGETAMYDSIALEVHEAYASKLARVRDDYRRGCVGLTYNEPTDVAARLSGWRRIRKFIEWSVTEDAAAGIYRPADVALWQRINRRMDALASRL
jgi:hypothetical protein